MAKVQPDPGSTPSYSPPTGGGFSNPPYTAGIPPAPFGPPPPFIPYPDHAAEGGYQQHPDNPTTLLGKH